MVIEKQGLYMPNGTFRSREEIDRKLSDEPSTENAVLKGRQPQEIKMVAKGLGVGVDVIMGTINRLREKGYHIEQQGIKLFIQQRSKEVVYLTSKIASMIETYILELYQILTSQANKKGLMP